MLILRFGALLSILLSGLIAGFFYAWVCSTMWGLDSLPPHSAIEAMNAMNISVRNAVFFPTFFLTPIVLAVTGLAALFAGYRTSGWAFVLGALIYSIGAFFPTTMVNVPMNVALENLPIPTNVDEARTVWMNYSERWQFWNQFRAVASGLCLLVAGWGLLKLPSTTP